MKTDYIYIWVQAGVRIQTQKHTFRYKRRPKQKLINTSNEMTKHNKPMNGYKPGQNKRFTVINSHIHDILLFLSLQLFKS